MARLFAISHLLLKGSVRRAGRGARRRSDADTMSCPSEVGWLGRGGPGQKYPGVPPFNHLAYLPPHIFFSPTPLTVGKIKTRSYDQSHRSPSSVYGIQLSFEQYDVVIEVVSAGVGYSLPRNAQPRGSLVLLFLAVWRSPWGRDEGRSG